MKRIRKYLIHLLGGVTKEESHEDVIYSSKMARADTILQFKSKMASCYGQPSEEWCKNVYEFTCVYCERAMKDLEKCGLIERLT